MDTETSAGKEQEDFIYVYGIIEKKQEIGLELTGLRGEPITTISFMRIAALVSPYPSLYPLLEEKEAMQHAKILNEIAEKITVIPTAYGTVFKSRDVLEKVLLKSHGAIITAFALIGGKIELGVKVVKQQADEIPKEIIKEILDLLNKSSVKCAEGNKFSERLLLNYSFLVEKNKFNEFSEKIAELESKHKKLKFLFTGPWPPYSFIDIKIKGEQNAAY